MTLINLIEDIKTDLGTLFKESKFKSSSGKHKSFDIYKGSLPIPDSEESPEPMPYIIVQLVNGEIGLSSNTVAVRLIIAIYDDDNNSQGYSDVLNVIEKIRQHYTKYPILNRKYFAKIDDKNSFEWSLPDEDTYPYYFGGVQLNFEIAHCEREDDFI